MTTTETGIVEKLERFIAMPEWPRFYMDKNDAACCVAALTRAAMPDSTQLLQTMAGAAERVLSWWPEPSEATSRSGQAKGDAFADDIHALRDVLAQFRAQEQRS